MCCTSQEDHDAASEEVAIARRKAQVAAVKKQLFCMKLEAASEARLDEKNSASTQMRSRSGEADKRTSVSVQQPQQRTAAVSGFDSSATSITKLQQRVADAEANSDLIECGLQIVQDDVSELQRSVKQAVARAKANESRQLQRESAAVAVTTQQLQQTAAANRAAVARLEASVAQLQQAAIASAVVTDDISDNAIVDVCTAGAEETAQLAVTTATEALDSAADASSRADDALYTADAAAATAAAASAKMDDAYVLLYHLDQQYMLILAQHKLLQQQCEQLQQQQQQQQQVVASTEQRTTADACTNTECAVLVSTSCWCVNSQVPVCEQPVIIEILVLVLVCDVSALNRSRCSRGNRYT
jgi:hypothetical protein